MATTKHKLEFTHAMARHTRATVRQCEALMRYAGTLQRIQEQRTYSISPGQTHLLKKRDRIVKKVCDICADLSGPGYVVPLFKGDPRNKTDVLKIRVPDGFSDTGDGEGIGVPA